MVHAGCSLADGLRRALSGRTNERQWGDDYAHCAPELAKVFAGSLTTIAREAPIPQPGQARDLVDRQADIADLLLRHSARLMALIERHRSVIRSAVRKQYLPPGFPPRAGTIGDFIDPPWTGEGAIETCLQQAVAQLKTWRTCARRSANARPGRKRTQRTSVASWIGFQLQKRGIPLTTARTGYFARVLHVVYEAAGITSGRDLSREARDGLEFLRSFTAYLAAHSNPRKPSQ
jgi:hypothetical protein